MSAMLKKPNDSESRTLVDALLEEQRSLTAVERFAQIHERNDLPSQEKFYRHLIPLNTVLKWTSTSVRAAKPASPPATR